MRARAYLDVNCATCHTPPGYTKLDLRWSTPLNQTHTIGLDPEKPRVGPPQSKIAKPGDPNHSELYLRMNHEGKGRMPNIGSSLVHPEGVETIRAWIKTLADKDDADAR
jgi:mono/diheme cytochrome c family protein